VLIVSSVRVIVTVFSLLLCFVLAISFDSVWYCCGVISDQ